MVDGSVTAAEYLGRFADQWRATDLAEHPYPHYVVDEVEGHDDGDQFRVGPDLLLAGLRLQATR